MKEKKALVKEQVFKCFLGKKKKKLSVEVCVVCAVVNGEEEEMSGKGQPLSHHSRAVSLIFYLFM